MLQKLEGLEIENRKTKEEQEGSKNRSMRKMLIFRNIPQE